MVGDYALRVLEVTPDATDAVLAENSFNAPPEPGNVFFLAKVEATYLERDTGKPGNDLDFNIVGDQNRGYSEHQASCGVIPESAFEAPELFPEGSAAFNVCWSVPEEEVGSFVMYVEAGFSDERVWFALDQDSPPVARDDAETPVGSAAPTLTLEAQDIAFSEHQITVSPGDTIEMTNTGMLAHDFTVDELGIHEVTPSTGDTVTITIPEDAEPGDYRFYCSVPGHKEAGMTGTLTVAGTDARGGERTSTPAAQGEDTQGKSIEIEAGDLFFQPGEIEVAPGDTITMTNDGMLEHDFAVDEWGGVLIGPLQGGESGSFTVPDDATPGTSFTFYCSIPGHRQAGMVGTLTVVAASDDGGEVALEGEEEPSTDTAVTAPPDAAAGPVRVDVEASDLFFEPNEFSIAPGGTIRLTNSGMLEHDFAVDEWGGVVIGPLVGGEEGTYTVPEDAKPGETFNFYCSIPGHKEAGMVGTVTIAEARAGGDAAAAAEGDGATAIASPDPSPLASPVAPPMASPAASPEASAVASPVSVGTPGVMASGEMIRTETSTRILWDEQANPLDGAAGFMPVSFIFTEEETSDSTYVFVELKNISGSATFASTLNVELYQGDFAFGAEQVSQSKRWVEVDGAVYYQSLNFYSNSIGNSDWDGLHMTLSSPLSQQSAEGIRIVEDRLYNDRAEPLAPVLLTAGVFDREGVFIGACTGPETGANIPPGGSLKLSAPADPSYNPMCGFSSAGQAASLDLGVGGPYSTNYWVGIVPW